MSITYPLALPQAEGNFRRIRFAPSSVVAVSVSPFTGQQQVQRHAGQWWSADVELPPMLRADAEPWIAFFLSLNGREGTFLLGDPGGASPRGTWAGTPVVVGAAQTGATLAIDGLDNGATVKAGDYFQIGSGSSARLYKNLTDQTAGAPGTLTLDIWPRLRTSPGDNDPLTVTAARGLFRLASNEMPFDLGEALFYGLSFSCMEAL